MNNAHPPTSGEYNHAVNDLGKIEEVIQHWNQIVAVYNESSNTQQTKDAILTSARQLNDHVGFIVTGLHQMVVRLARVVSGMATARERKGHQAEPQRGPTWRG
jgi:hypothetical protein